MNDKLQNVLAELATKLNISIDKLYSIYMTQVKIDILKDTIGMLIGLLFVIWAINIIIQGIKTEDFLDEMNMTQFVYFIIICVCGIIGAAFIMCTISDMIDAIFNPSYWAIHHILHPDS